MAIDLKKLEKNLETLTGVDFEKAELAARAKGDMSAFISLSSIFQAELAAIVLGITSQEIKILPIKEYSQVVGKVSGFLFANLGEMKENAPEK